MVTYEERLNALLDKATRLGRRRAVDTAGVYADSGPLSGEWADQWTPAVLYAALGIDPEGWNVEDLDDVCRFFEDAYREEVADWGEPEIRDDTSSLDALWWAEG